jgi:hypothetical protein
MKNNTLLIICILLPLALIPVIIIYNKYQNGQDGKILREGIATCRLSLLSLLFKNFLHAFSSEINVLTFKVDKNCFIDKSARLLKKSDVKISIRC